MRIAFCLLFALGLSAQEPADFRGWLNLGVSHFKSAHYPEAVQAFQRAVALEPSNSAGRLYLATAYMQQYIPGAESPANRDNARLAEAEFVRVLDTEPQNKVALASLASLNLNQRKFDDALQWYGKVI